MALSSSHILEQEYSQAKIRIIIVSTILLYMFFNVENSKTVLVAVSYFVYSIVNLYSIYKINKESKKRRFFNIISDISAMAYAIYIGDFNAIIIFPGLLWMIIGNGMRFGVKSLFLTLIVSEIALVFVMKNDSYWSNHTDVMYMMLISLFGVSVFYLYMITKMHNTNALLEKRVAQRISEVKHIYLHDSLTGLKNRVALIDDLKKNSFSGLILIDIDNFHNYNEIYGIEIGNKILKDIAKCLKMSELVKKYELYRIGGDHFVLRKKYNIEIEKITDEDIKGIIEFFSEVKITTEDLNDILEIDITVGASYGKESVLSMVEMALKHAKENKMRYFIYTKYIDSTFYSKSLLSMKNKTKQALANSNIIPVYHAIVDKNGHVIKYEALMRLREIKDNKEILISPFFFLDVAIKSKMYPQLTLMMIDKTFKEMSDLKLEFSINLTFEDMINEEIVTALREKIEKYKIGKQVIFEIVESENIDDFQHAKKFVEQFKKMGVKIAIDDFGTGYSNFIHIFELEPDYLKIDGSLIKNIEKDKKSYELVTSIVYFSKSLGIKTIAEFVSSKKIFEICSNLGVDEFQGYYFYEPVKGEELKIVKN